MVNCRTKGRDRKLITRAFRILFLKIVIRFLLWVIKRGIKINIIVEGTSISFQINASNELYLEIDKSGY